MWNKILLSVIIVVFCLNGGATQSNQYYFVYQFTDQNTPGISVMQYHEWVDGHHYSIVIDSSKVDRIRQVEKDERGLISDVRTTYTFNYLGTRLPVYKNYNDNSIVRTVVSPEGFLSDPKTEIIAEDLNDFKWELTGESKYIDSLLCYKAITHFRCQTFEVWYSPEIPVSAGPTVLHGLPGLIVQAEISEMENQSITLKSFGKLKHPTLNKSEFGFDQLDFSELPTYCDLKEAFDRFVSIIKAQAGDPDCTNCEMIVHNLSWSECWDNCE